MTDRTKIKFTIPVLILLSAFINYYVASRGAFPVDTFVHFDNGFRILEGEYPIKDYWIVHGLLVDYMQSIFFWIFGSNWFSYTIHSSLFNSGICVFSFVLFFKYLKIGFIESLFFSLLISFLAYPVSGTPFLDFHSVYFSLFAIYFTVIAILSEQTKYWFLSSFLLGIAFFCKQVPAFYIIFTTTIFCIYLSIIKNKIKIFLFYFYGGLSFGILLLLFLLLQGIELKDFILQLFLFPQSIGASRYLNYDLNFKNVFLDYKFIYLFLFILIITNINFLYKIRNYSKSKKINIFIILFLFTISCIFHQIYTKNQIFIFFLIPILGSFSIFYLRDTKKNSFNYLKFFIIASCFLLSLKYTERFNVDRKFHELNNTKLENRINIDYFDKKFKGLKWITPNFENPYEEIEMLEKLKTLLNDDKGNKMLITEYNFFSTILNESLNSPSRTYDNISYPNKNSKFFKEYQLFLIKKVKEKDIGSIYIMEPTKINQIRLNHLIFNYIPEDCFTLDYVDNYITKLEIKKCEQLQ